MRRKIVLIGSLAALLSACRLLQPSLASHAEAPWFEVRSGAFRVLAKADADAARDTCADLELLRAAIAAATRRPRLQPRIPITIFLFASERTAPRIPEEPRIKGSMRSGVRDHALLVFTPRTRELTAQFVLFSEYAHLALHEDAERLYPAWYDSGFAQLFGATRIDREHVVVGGFPQHLAPFATHLGPRMSVREVVSGGPQESSPPKERASFSLESWRLTHYLLLGPGRPQDGGPSPLSRYLASEASLADGERAWEAAFGYDFDELADRIDAYADLDRIPARAFTRASLAAESCGDVRPVPGPEMATELGWVALLLERPEEARASFEAALRADPGDARAHAGLGDVCRVEGRWKEALSHYERALALGPDDFRNHVDLARWAIELPADHGGGDEKLALARAQLEIAARLAPNSAEPDLLLAESYLVPGQDASLGIPHAQRAARLLPANDQVQLTLARVYVAAGERDAARRRLERLVAVSHSRAATSAALLLGVLEGTGSAPGDGHARDPQRGSGGGAEP